MRIGTLNQGLDIYTGIARTGSIVFQFVLNADFQNAPKVFLNAEEAEKLIAALDIFLAKKTIQKPIIITNIAKGNNIQVMTQNEQFLILLTTTFGNTNIYLSKLQSLALKRFLINWPIYGTIQTIINTIFRSNNQTLEQSKTQITQQKNFQTNSQYINNTKTQIQQINEPQTIPQIQTKINEQQIIQQNIQTSQDFDNILNELDDLIGE